ncbi:E2F-associated phosphoprotein, putative [Perkinsus marinus ATCC 50983]|uniref:E2F-associated phosphoprotein, putative n=1 Tax=Perkinsus marinus (strain ATCC 50983 / TXsc) TaxID=423536 RepID=C5LDW6_PERM5|nr:E2F-associated phosphoprotein, putative [Perkinsus marinus ATCC 50983]EER05130.1 E2F-associated phosphoprotein, putative [Perkinsus marinus ATCC 50983]|eukprot:XP_002773314.1 E2F-associated phosphoprotein, putative [Perkinsus marinus ATCC 50983]
MKDSSDWEPTDFSSSNSGFLVAKVQRLGAANEDAHNLAKKEESSPTRKRSNDLIEKQEKKFAEDPLKDDLYDPDMDDKDEEFVNQFIHVEGTEDGEQQGGSRRRKVKHSDAVLSCPQCFTQICYVCQEHTRYSNQYRAVEVRNCRVDEDKVTSYKDGPDTYNPVYCSNCGLQVAMRDRSDGVYHIFDCIKDDPRE